MEEETVKILCSFCSKEIESPLHMKDARYHACYECFSEKEEELSALKEGELHVDAPLDEMGPDVLVNLLMEKEFPELWKEAKDDLKELSQKEIAKHMFAAGAYRAVQMIMEMGKED